jgi:cyanophycin synthetase
MADMKFGQLFVLRGPNVWARVPVLEVEVEPGESAWPADLGVCLAGWLSPLARNCLDCPLQTLPAAPTPAHALQAVALELQCMAECDVAFGAARQGPRPGLWRVAVEYEEEALGRACLEAARALCNAARRRLPFDLPAVVGKLRDLAHAVRLGPSTAAIVRAARQRGIPVHRLNEDSLVQLGQGARARRVCAAETDRTGVIAEAVAQDKELTRILLRAAGVPVPSGRPVADADDAWEAAEDVGLPVVVKPRDGNHGRGVSTNLTTRDAVRRAYAAARAESSQVIVERYVPGADHRLLVVGGKLVAAALREPAQVTGDGRSTIRQLVEEANRDPRRSDGHATVLSFIKLDPVALGVLSEQGFTPESVPAAAVRVLIRRNGNLSTGGTATDVTDRVHPAVAARVLDAARAVGLDVAGVDVISTDVARPLEEVGGGVVEVNAVPGLRMHLEPSAGKPRPVGEAVVDLLFPGGETGRILVAAVTGVRGRTATTRLLAHLLRQAGHVVGMTCADGVYLGDRCLDRRDGRGWHGVRAVHLNPWVGAAVFETAGDCILREGLGFEECDVAVVTAIGHGGQPGSDGEAVEELAQVKRTVVESVAPSGAAVLDAADPLVAAMAGHCPGGVVFFARDADQPVLAAQRQAGGRVAFVRGGALVLESGREESVIPLPPGGEAGLENTLAASAAAWALGVSLDAIQAGLDTVTAAVAGAFSARKPAVSPT